MVTKRNGFQEIEVYLFKPHVGKNNYIVGLII